MNKFILALLVGFLSLGPLMPAHAEDFEIFPGCKVLPELFSVGGTGFCDFTSGGTLGNWGLGINKNLLQYENIYLRYDTVGFQSYTANGFSAFYDLTNHFKGLTILNYLSGAKVGIWFGRRVDSNVYVGGMAVDVLKGTFLP